MGTGLRLLTAIQEGHLAAAILVTDVSLKGREAPPPTSISVSIQVPQWLNMHHQLSLPLQNTSGKAVIKSRLPWNLANSLSTHSSQAA